MHSVRHEAVALQDSILNSQRKALKDRMANIGRKILFSTFLQNAIILEIGLHY